MSAVEDDPVRILVVDEDPDTAEIFEALLREEMPVAVESVCDAATARRLIRNGFDLVTLDCDLPDESWLSFLEELVSDEAAPPVIVVSTSDDAHLAIRSYQMGAAGYVIKDGTLRQNLSEAAAAALATSALRRAADLLNRESAFTGMAVNALEEFFLALDPHGRIIRWNSRLKELTRLEDEELRLMDCAALFTLDGAARLLDAVLGRGDARRTRMSMDLLSGDGRTIPCELTAVLLKEGSGALSTICVIGHETGADAAGLPGSRGRELPAPTHGDTGGDVRPGGGDAAIAELTGEIIVRTDTGGRLVYANADACGFWDLDPARISETIFTDTVCVEDLERTRELIRYLLCKGCMVRGFIGKTTTARGRRFVEWNAVPLKDRSGRSSGFQFTGRDVTDRQTGEEFLHRVNRELDEYAHTVSHDLKGPLSVIMLAAETLRLKLAGGAPFYGETSLADMARIISEHSSQAGAMVDALLELAESGQVPLEVEDVELLEVVNEVVGELGDRLRGSGIEVAVDRDLGRITGSRIQLRQVFYNLLQNSVEHGAGLATRIEVRYLGSDLGYHGYLVRDDGGGIPVEELPRVFEPFYSGERGGTGIGLATVAKIVNAYDGFIRAYNEGGACFYFGLKDRARGAGV